MEDKHYNAMLDCSILYPNNNHRLCAQLRNMTKSRVKVLLLGGSITAGYSPLDNITHPYPMLIKMFMKEQFPSTQFNFINLAYSALHSLFGLAQCERWMTSQQHADHNSHQTPIAQDEQLPFIVLEYATNNGFEMEYAKSFEGLIRKLLHYYPNAAILILCTRNKAGYTCEPYMAKIAAHYSLPVISINNALSYGQAYGLTWEDYSMDLVHPTPYGHKIIADCVIQLIKTSLLQASKHNTDITLDPGFDPNGDSGTLLPPSIYGDEFDGALYFDADQIPEANRGDFVAHPTHPLFPQGLSCHKTSTNPLTLTLMCEKLYLLYEQSADAEVSGKISVDITNLSQTTIIDSYSIYAWGNPTMIKLIDGPRQTYTLQIRMVPTLKNASFQILGFLSI